MLLMFIFLILFPSFSRADDILRFTVEEKSSINTFIADLSDLFQIESLASYSLVELFASNEHFFTINNQTGHLITTGNNLDREELCTKQRCSCQSCDLIYHLIIRTSRKIISKILQIHIRDRNDHSPMFDSPSKRHVIYMKENVPLGHRIVLPTANDPDEGLNSIQSYSLTGIHSNDFDLDYSSIDIPYLIVRSALDHQRVSSYSLTLIASDNNQRSGSMQIDIRITNQSMPVFLQSVYHVDIREDTSIGTNVLKIDATSDGNEQIFYELLGQSPFVIDRLTGKIQLKKLLDYEREQTYRLTVKAYENTIPSYAIIFIHVIDVNDNPVLIHIRTEDNVTMKRLSNDQYTLGIPEDIPVGRTIGHVILQDLDSSANGNPYLQLTIIEPPLPFMYKLIYQNPFENLKIYSLILHTKLDRELKSIYKNLQLLASDSGTPTLQTRINMFLNITDVNDCIPRIVNNMTIYHVDENNPLGLIIDTLIGFDEDLDVNGELEYSVLNETNLLIVNSRTGQMSLNQSIDFEEFHPLKNQTTIDLDFLIEIKDHGQPSLSSTRKITLRIRDLNDHAPQFDVTQSYHWNISKSMVQSGVVLGRIIAYDNDSGLQGIIHYSINVLDSCFILDITSLGYVYLLSQSECALELHQFEIIARDYGTPNPRLTKQILLINIHADQGEILPQILPYSTQRTIVDVNSRDKIAFILDITNNQTIQPIVSLNNSDLSICWNVSPTGEIRLIGQPYASSYVLSLNILDQYTQENVIRRLQIDLCNSSISHSCQRSITKNNDRKEENEILLFWAIGLALIITFLCVFIVSMITCLCCRRTPKKGFSKNQQIFLQSNEDLNSEKICKTSSISTIREDDRDSACVVNTNSSSLSSSIIPIQTSRSKSSNDENYQASTYFYDLKLAELLRNNRHPPCVYVNSQSFNSDYGFESSQVSPSLTSSSSMKFNQSNANASDWTVEMTVDSSPQRQTNPRSFISTCECVV